MPIKPENRHRYPPNWTAIRNAILLRGGYCCEQCGVHDGHRGAWVDGVWCDACPDEFGARLRWPKPGQEWTVIGEGRWYRAKIVRIVLTVAHLDHTPENCAPENLRAWCQRCHLRYDAKHHAETARATRRGGKAVSDLFAETGSRDLPE